MSEKNELAIINKEQFLTKFEPSAMVMKFRHIKTVSDAIKEDSNGISLYAKELGEDTVMAVIELHLLSLSQAVNVSNKLTKVQIQEIAIEIMAVYYFLSMVEICYVLRKAKRGDYGKFYNAMSMPEVLSWFADYTELRIKDFIDNQAREHDNHKDDSLRSEDRKVLRRHEQLKNERKK